MRSWWARASWEERVGRGLAWAGVLIGLAVSFRGIGGPFPDGHYASTSVIGTAVFNMRRWDTWLPVQVYSERFPGPSTYYVHHPLGMYWVIWFFSRLFGFHDWVLRLPPLIYLPVTTWLLAKIGRELWGQLAGGLCALAYVALPITLGFANYHDLEQPVMFGTVLATWGYVRYVRTWRERYAVASVLGFFYALNHDWPAYMWGAAFLGLLFVYLFLIPPGRRAELRDRSVARYWAFMCLAAVLALAIEIGVLAASTRISDVLSSYMLRSAGADTPLSAVLAARRYRIELMFTGLGIALGKLALPVIVFRAWRGRSHLELLPLPLFFCALVQYVAFKQGADVHIFWPHYFATYFALGIGALVASATDGAGWLARRLEARRPGRAWSAWVPWVAAAVVGLPVLLVLKDGLSIGRLARETGGRFAEANLDTDLDKEAVLRWFLARMPPGAGVAYHGAIHDGWALQWELRPRLSAANQPVAGGVSESTRVYILDTRLASLGEIRQAAAQYQVHAVGYLWVFDRKQPPAPLDGYELDEREPSFWQRWWLGPTEPIRSVRPSPWVTWEWRTMMGQPAAEPAGTPASPDELRIAHNAALRRGDAAGAARLRAQLMAQLNVHVTAAYEGGTSLIGEIARRGARRSLTMFFVAGAFPGDARFSVHARVLAPPAFSTLPAAPEDLEIAGSPTWPTSLWRPGEIYSLQAVYRKRPGTDVLTGTWTPGPRRIGGRGPLELLRP
ncbi:MAG TPA: glycosyltransferase family 39 protein [Polyangia bacterium]|nr:glycosyltransferase family 39 protein [Polyangia bacterium]